MLKSRSRPFAGSFCRMVATNARLNIFLQLVESNIDGFPMRHPHALVASDQRCERDTLGCAEGGIPSRPVLHGVDSFALAVQVLIG